MSFKIKTALYMDLEKQLNCTFEGILSVLKSTSSLKVGEHEEKRVNVRPQTEITQAGDTAGSCHGNQFWAELESR